MPARAYDPESAAGTLRTFIARRFLPRRQRALTDDEALVTSGVVDSLGLVDLTAFIEEEFGVLLTPDRFGAGRVDTVRDIVAALARG